MRKIQKGKKNHELYGHITENKEELEELTFLSWDDETEYVLRAHPDCEIRWIYLNHHEGRKSSPIIRSLYCGNEPSCEVSTQVFTQHRLSMGFCLKKSKFPFRYQKILSVSDPAHLLSNTDQPTGCFNLIDTVLLGLNSPCSLLGSARVWWCQSRSPGAIGAHWCILVFSLLTAVEVKQVLQVL